jgi:hypothetical protein
MARPKRALEPSSERGGEQLRRRSHRKYRGTGAAGFPQPVDLRSVVRAAGVAGPPRRADDDRQLERSRIRELRTAFDPDDDWLDRAGPEGFREGGNGGRERSNGGQVCALQ